MTTDLRDRIAEALMAWAERNNDPYNARFRRSETVQQNASGRADAVLAVVQPELDRLRAACRSAAVLLRATADQPRPDSDALRAAARELDTIAQEAPRA